MKSDNSIYIAEPDGKNPIEIYKSGGGTLHLVGATPAYIFYQEDGKLFCLSEGETTEVISEEYAFYTSLYADDSHMLHCMAYSDAADAPATVEYVQVVLDRVGE